jgi:predicted nucleic acid-binding protein
MYCIDTDIVIADFRGDESVKERLRGISTDSLFVTPITLCELYRGAFLSGNVEKNKLLISKLLEKVNILNFDLPACEIFGNAYKMLRNLGKLTQDSDLMTASICISYNLILITRNKKHFEKIKGLKVEEW